MAENRNSTIHIGQLNLRVPGKSGDFPNRGIRKDNKETNRGLSLLK